MPATFLCPRNELGRADLAEFIFPENEWIALFKMSLQ
jgi:hypothetical protein